MNHNMNLIKLSDDSNMPPYPHPHYDYDYYYHYYNYMNRVTYFNYFTTMYYYRCV